jgi:hypothetical protein
LEQHALADGRQLGRHEPRDRLGSRPVRDGEDLRVAHPEGERRDLRRKLLVRHRAASSSCHLVNTAHALTPGAP